jgi:hypothetical protein
VHSDPVSYSSRPIACGGRLPVRCMGFQPMLRVAVAAVLAGQGGAVFGWVEIPFSSSITWTLISEAAAAPMGGACPAENFFAFIDAFAESATIQRRYTRAPLKYGQLDATLLGTSKEDEAFSTRTVNSFEAIPLFDRKEGGRIFPTGSQEQNKVWRSGSTLTASMAETELSLPSSFRTPDSMWSIISWR